MESNEGVRIGKSRVRHRVQKFDDSRRFTRSKAVATAFKMRNPISVFNRHSILIKPKPDQASVRVTLETPGASRLLVTVS